VLDLHKTRERSLLSEMLRVLIDDCTAGAGQIRGAVGDSRNRASQMIFLADYEVGMDDLYRLQSWECWKGMMAETRIAAGFRGPGLTMSLGRRKDGAMKAE
jgi:dGTP triphosphohydrolase